MLVKFVLQSVFRIGVVDRVKVALKISIGQFVGRLEFAVILVVFLDCIVSEMYKLVVEVFHVELF